MTSPKRILLLLALLLPSTTALPQPHVHHHQEMRIVEPYHPQDARTQEVNDWARRIEQGQRRAESEIQEIRRANLPVIARERLLVHTVRALRNNPDEQALPVLHQLAVQEPEAVYLAPDCRYFQPHPYYDFAAEARQAIAATVSRSIRKSVHAAELHTADGVKSLSAIRRESAVETPYVNEEHLQTIYALERLANENTSDATRHAAWQKYIGQTNPPIDNAVLQLAREHNMKAFLRQQARTSNDKTAIQAFVYYNKLRTNQEPINLADWIDNGSPQFASAVIAQLKTSDDSPANRQQLLELFNDTQLGGGAAASLARITGDQLPTIASEIIAREPNATLRERRALLALKVHGSPAAQVILAEYAKANQSDSPEVLQLKQQVAQWLHE